MIEWLILAPIFAIPIYIVWSWLLPKKTKFEIEWEKAEARNEKLSKEVKDFMNADDIDYELERDKAERLRRFNNDLHTHTVIPPQSIADNNPNIISDDGYFHGGGDI